MSEVTNPEDLKLITLARAARARIGSSAGSAVRDQDGRTYSGATVHLADGEISAARLAVATAIASGAKSLEAVVLLGETFSTADTTIINDVIQPSGLLIECAINGDVISVTSA